LATFVFPEYTGEMITHEEADARGRFYDDDDFTCLFDLSQETVLDAGRAGSKAKFANHSFLNPNAISRIMDVSLAAVFVAIDSMPFCPNFSLGFI
jgi:SET domain-containing protein